MQSRLYGVMDDWCRLGGLGFSCGTLVLRGVDTAVVVAVCVAIGAVVRSCPRLCRRRPRLAVHVGRRPCWWGRGQLEETIPSPCMNYTCNAMNRRRINDSPVPATPTTYHQLKLHNCSWQREFVQSVCTLTISTALYNRQTTPVIFYTG